MAEDNWAHRSPNMCCATCMWFVAKVRTTLVVPEDGGVARQGELPCDLGHCRRNAPTMSGYPAVFKSDWCGQHKLDENKLV